MKRVVIVFLVMSLLFCFAACGRAPAVTTTPTPDTSPQISKASEKSDDASIETLLKNIFTLDGFETLVDVKDGEATVFLTADTIGDAFVQASSGDEAAIEQWDKLVSSFLELHETALAIVSEYSIDSFTTTIFGKNDFPYISIENGEVTIDLLHLGDD